MLVLMNLVCRRGSTEVGLDPEKWIKVILSNSRLCGEGENKRGCMGRVAVIHFSLSRICEPELSLMEIASQSKDFIVLRT